MMHSGILSLADIFPAHEFAAERVWRGRPRPRLLTLNLTLAGAGARATRTAGGDAGATKSPRTGWSASQTPDPPGAGYKPDCRERSSYGMRLRTLHSRTCLPRLQGRD